MLYGCYLVKWLYHHSRHYLLYIRYLCVNYCEFWLSNIYLLNFNGLYDLFKLSNFFKDLLEIILISFKSKLSYFVVNVLLWILQVFVCWWFASTYLVKLIILFFLKSTPRHFAVYTLKKWKFGFANIFH